MNYNELRPCTLGHLVTLKVVTRGHECILKTKYVHVCNKCIYNYIWMI